MPTILAAVYYGLLASDRYVSETQFIVRGVNSQQFGGLSVLLRTFGIDRSNDDAYAIQTYIESRDAVEDLSRTIDLRAVFGHPDADYFSRFGTLLTGQSSEALYWFYLRRMDLVESVETGITTLRIHAHSAVAAEAIARRLLELSEEQVNAINARARADTLGFAEEALARAADEIVTSQIALTRFRNAEMLISPDQAASGSLEVISTLSQELAQEQVRLRQMQMTSPSSPNIAAIRERVRSLEQRIDAERSNLVGSDAAIANKLSAYEELLLRRTLAEKSYEAATVSLQEARQEAARKQIYLEALVQPKVADESRDPLRLRMVATVAILSFVIFVMSYLLVAGGREHLNLDG